MHRSCFPTQILVDDSIVCQTGNARPGLQGRSELARGGLTREELEELEPTVASQHHGDDSSGEQQIVHAPLDRVEPLPDSDRVNVAAPARRR
jgi:hypothetical protein